MAFELKLFLLIWVQVQARCKALFAQDYQPCKRQSGQELARTHTNETLEV